MFEHLCRKHPGEFQEGQLRTLQRRFKQWRIRSGPEREVMFPQVHDPGRQCQSDFTHMGSLMVTIGGQKFDHMAYHFVLTYSNWETVTVCFSESFEEPVGRPPECAVASGRRLVVKTGWDATIP